MRQKTKAVAAVCAGLLLINAAGHAQEARVLTLEQSINIALNRSHQVKQLEQSLLNSRLNLRAAEAGLKSYGDLVFSSLPNLREGISQTQIGTGEFVFPRQNFVDLQAELYVN